MGSGAPGRVSVGDSLRYGVGLIGYALAVGLLGGFLLALGGRLLNPFVPAPGFGVMGTLFTLAGLVVLFAGMLGVGYKVIADAVAVGHRMAD